MMNKPKLLLLSGKMGSGKTDLIKYLNTRFNMKSAMCKDMLHPIVGTFFNVPEETYWSIYNDREAKERPCSMFSVSEDAVYKLLKIIDDITFKGDWVGLDKIPLTIREAMIYVSECVMKPTFGSAVFGERRSELIANPRYLYYDDSYGFVEEIIPVINKLGQENILCLRISGRGDKKHDSRQMLPDGVLDNVVDIWNGREVTLEAFFGKCEEAVNKFIYNNS